MFNFLFWLLLWAWVRLWTMLFLFFFCHLCYNCRILDHLPISWEPSLHVISPSWWCRIFHPISIELFMFIYSGKFLTGFYDLLKYALISRKRKWSSSRKRKRTLYAVVDDDDPTFSSSFLLETFSCDSEMKLWLF